MPQRYVCYAWMGGRAKGLITHGVGWGGGETHDSITDEKLPSGSFGPRLPRTDELVTRRQPPPPVDGLEGSEIERQIFHTVGATVVEVNTRGDFGGFARHRGQQHFPGHPDTTQPHLAVSPHPDFTW